MIYLATPYSHPSPAMMEYRFARACEIAGALMKQGQIILCPVAHSHPIAVRCALPREFEYWEKYDRAILQRCDKLVVAKMEGWKDSRGVTAEIAIAKELGLPIEFMEVSE